MTININCNHGISLLSSCVLLRGFINLIREKVTFIFITVNDTALIGWFDNDNIDSCYPLWYFRIPYSSRFYAKIS